MATVTAEEHPLESVQQHIQAHHGGRLIDLAPVGGNLETGNLLHLRLSFAGGHTASNAPDLFRPPKLSGAGPG